MIGRRSLLGGVMVSWGVGRPGGSGFGGNPPMRPDQVSQRPRTVAGSGPAPQQSLIRAREVLVGANGQPQVIIDSTLNLTVVMAAGTGTDVASFTNLRAVVRFPTNNADESQQALMGSTVITYTDASVAMASLILGPETTSATAGGQFELQVAESSGTGGHLGGTIFGTYTASGTTITLTPQFAMNINGALILYVGAGANTGVNLANGTTLVGIPQAYTALVLNAAWSAVAGYDTPEIRLNAFGNFEVIGRVSGNPGTSSTIATLPAGFFAPLSPHTVPASVASSGGVNAGQSPRLTLTTGGAIQINGLAAGAATVDLETTFLVNAG